MKAEVTFLHPQPAHLSSTESALATLQRAYQTMPMPSARQRTQWLGALRTLLVREQAAIITAITADYGHRSADEIRLGELLPSLESIRFAQRRVNRWMKPVARSVSLMFFPARARVVYQPKGVIGIIVPWNYPLFLSIAPLVSALAAGNRVMLKMSEYTPATGALLKTLLERTFGPEMIHTVLGESDIGAAFSQLPFDHLVFTGTTHVGRQVMRAAASNLTPVTLELGGKTPAIVGRDSNLVQAAERIAFGKNFNAGQTCVAPDYVLIPRERLQGFIDAYRAATTRLYPSLVDNPDYTSIANEPQMKRLNNYLQDAAHKGARFTTLYPLEQNRGRCMAPVLLHDVTDNMLIMREEVFGPLLPLVPYDSLDDALAYVNQRPAPLALYYFGHERKAQQYVIEHTHSGGVCLNDTLLQCVQKDLPFGGFGASGMGHYQGREGFIQFSHTKAVLTKQGWSPIRWIYPPYSKPILRWVYRWMIR
jgi:coniferyl-aldehyde dehydrogenase